jgi:hypothetical protein
LIERRGEERREEAMATRNQTALFRKYREAGRISTQGIRGWWTGLLLIS